MIIACRGYFCQGILERGKGALAPYFFFVQSFQGGYQGAAEVLDAAEGEGFQGVANDVFFQEKGAVVFRAVGEGCVFRRKPPPNSDSFRHLIPIQVATQFRLIPPWESDPFRHPLGEGVDDAG